MKTKHVFYLLVFLLAVYLAKLQAAATSLNIGLKGVSNVSLSKGIIKFRVTLNVTNPDIVPIPIRSVIAANYVDTAIFGVGFLTTPILLKAGATTALPIEVEVPISDLPAVGIEILDGVKTIRFKGRLRSLGVNFPFDEVFKLPKLR